MTEPSMLPLFAPGTDPGPSFVDLLRQVAPGAVPLPQVDGKIGRAHV